MDAADVASAIGQVASATLAVPAIFVAYFAYKVSRSAAAAASALTSIEQMRLHAEMRPQFEISAFASNIPDTAFLNLTLVGPPALHGLEDVRVIIRSDGEARVRSSPAWVLAGLGVDLDKSYDEHPLSLTINDPVSIAIRTTIRAQTAKRRVWPVIRLSLACHREGFEPWLIPITVSVQIPPGLPIWRRLTPFQRDVAKASRESIKKIVQQHDRRNAENEGSAAS